MIASDTTKIIRKKFNPLKIHFTDTADQILLSVKTTVTHSMCSIQKVPIMYRCLSIHPLVEDVTNSFTAYMSWSLNPEDRQFSGLAPSEELRITLCKCFKTVVYSIQFIYILFLISNINSCQIVMQCYNVSIQTHTLAIVATASFVMGQPAASYNYLLEGPGTTSTISLHIHTVEKHSCLRNSQGCHWSCNKYCQLWGSSETFLLLTKEKTSQTFPELCDNPVKINKPFRLINTFTKRRE